MSFHALGIDVGGTKIAAGRVTFPGGRVSARRLIPAEPGRGGSAVLADVERIARELQRETEQMGQSIGGIGLGICELVDREGRIASSNCIQWQGLAVSAQLGSLAPAVIEADVRAAAVGEALLGAGRSYGTFVYITIGTGISSCLMVEGQPYLGASGATGTMASSPLSVPCMDCGKVNEHTLEQIASGPALVTRFNALGGKAQSGQEVLAAARSGNSMAASVVGNAGQILGAQIGALINVLDPEAIVIGGGLGLSEGLFWEHLVRSAHEHIWAIHRRGIPILRAQTGPDAGWIGAAACAWRRFGGDEARLPRSR